MTNRLRPNLRMALFGGAVLSLIAAIQPAGATIIFQAGNNQYTNVNIAADIDAMSIVGDIGNTGVTMTFEHMVGPDGTTLVSMHGQHGVAFVESTADSVPNTTHTGFSTLWLVPQAGYGFTAGDFSLDQLNSLLSPTGFVSLDGIDQFGTLTHYSLPILISGQNPFNFYTQDGELVTRIVISVATTDLLRDIKQVSVNVARVPVPEPGTLALLGLGLAGLGLSRRRKA